MQLPTTMTPSSNVHLGNHCLKPAQMPPSNDVELLRERSEFNSSSSSTVVGENSIKISETSVSHTYERISIRSTLGEPRNTAEVAQGDAVTDVDSGSSTNPTATKILSFITDRLQKDLEAGASVDELEQRLQSGLEGFKKGFSEAKAQLESMGLLSDVVNEEITGTYNSVMAGIEDLRTRFVSGEENTENSVELLTTLPNADVVNAKNSHSVVNNEEINKSASKNQAANRHHSEHLSNTIENKHVKNSGLISSFRAIENKAVQNSSVQNSSVQNNVTVMESFSRSERVSQTDSSKQFYHKQVGVKDSFTFQVETADGDKVTITAKTNDVSISKYNGEKTFGGMNQQGIQLSRYSDQDSLFSIDIDGDLDEEELKALGDLLNKVENLSVNFFEGNIDQSYQQAVSLGYDTNEIVGFSLSLQHVEIERVRSAYQEFLPSNKDASQLSNLLNPVGSFAQDLIDAAQIASAFAEPYSLIVDLSEHLEAYREAQLSREGHVSQNENTDSALGNTDNRFSTFVKNLLEANVSA